MEVGAHGRAAKNDDYVHSTADDHSRLDYSKILADERGTTCATFMERAIVWFSSLGVKAKDVITDNHMSRMSRVVPATLEALGARHLSPLPHGRTGKHRGVQPDTLQIEWAYRLVIDNNQE